MSAYQYIKARFDHPLKSPWPSRPWQHLHVHGGELMLRLSVVLLLTTVVAACISVIFCWHTLLGLLSNNSQPEAASEPGQCLVCGGSGMLSHSTHDGFEHRLCDVCGGSGID